MGKVLELKEPPNYIDLEREVLGSAFNGNHAADIVTSWLDETDFYNTKHRDIFLAMKRLRKSGTIIDAMSLSLKMGVEEWAFDVAEINHYGVGADIELINQNVNLLRKISVQRKLKTIESIEELDKVPELMRSLSIGKCEEMFIAPEDVLNQTLEYHKEGNKRGYSIGFDMDQCYNVSKGQLTIITGIPGHGKTEFVDSILVNMANTYDWKFVVFSPENFPISRHVRKLVEKYLSTPMFSSAYWHEDMNEKDLINAIEWINSHFKFLNPKPEQRTLDILLAQIENVDGFLIDPWNELESTRPDGMTETEFIGQCLMKAKAYAALKNVHIWIVAHPTKLQRDKNGNYPVPTPYDISGSANWRNKADNCITIYRPDHTKHEVEIHIQKIRFKDNGKISLLNAKYDYLTGVFSDFNETQ